MFCRAKWREVAPEDKDLKRYRDWLVATGGEGAGLQRAPLAGAAAGTAAGVAGAAARAGGSGGGGG